MNKIIYVKFSNERSDEFSIKTAILTNGKERYILKEAVKEEALTHIKNIKNINDKLEIQYNFSDIKINQSIMQDRAVKLEFVSGETLESILDGKMQKQDFLGIIDTIKTYKEKMLRRLPKEEFVVSDQFKRVFGEVTFTKPQQALKVSDIDLIFSNIIVNDEGWNIIDYEWTFDFPIPEDFILYRAIVNYLYGSNKRECLWHLNLQSLFGISDEQEEQFNIMEQNFQNYVSGNRKTLIEIGEVFNKSKYNIVDYVDGYVPGRIQIFYDYGEGYSEDNSEFVNCKVVDGKYSFEIDVDPLVKRYRIDPSDKCCLLKIDSATFWDVFDAKVDFAIEHNGCNINDNYIAFFHGDPQLWINACEKKKIKVNYTLTVLDEMFCKDSEDDFFQMISIMNNQEEELENRAIELDNRMNVINDLTNSGEIKENEIKLLKDELERRAIELENRMNVINDLTNSGEIKENEIKLLNDELERRAIELENRMNVINELTNSGEIKDQLIAEKDKEIDKIRNHRIINRIINRS